ncbi:hypothetical protein [Devosia sp.]|uniref:hypothetical protein n=1 Tax=Devosia sp. TaxID=1871048 RepID=UPI002AFF3DC6|nr:hypothetical protein [Devosia sp.]
MMLANALALGAIRRGGGGASYDPDAEALFARFTTPPTQGRKGLINTLIVALKGAGVWSKLDVLWLAGADAQATRRNWIADQYNLGAVSSPVFTIDRGYQGDGSAGYLSTSFNPSTAVSAKFTRNSASIFLWSRTDVDNQQAMGNGNTVLVPRSSVDATCRVNNAGTATASTGGQSRDALGYFSAIRSGASNERLRRGGVTIATRSDAASSAPDNSELTFLRRNTFYSTLQLAAGGFGAALTDAEDGALCAAITDYLQAIGAAA